MNKFLHTCEVCGKQEMLTPEEAYMDGWDYPPDFGAFGTLSARTCGDCPIHKTVWWKIAIDKCPTEKLTQHDHEVIRRILDEKNLIFETENE